MSDSKSTNAGFPCHFYRLKQATLRVKAFKRPFVVVFVLALILGLSSCASILTPLVTPQVRTELSSLKPGQYRLDKSHATVLFKVQHLGLSTYVGRFNDMDATLEFDPKNTQAASLTAIIEMGSVDINDQDLEQTLLGGAWFNHKNYPQAVFTSKRVSSVNENTFEFTGDLQWRGVQKPIVMTAVFHGGANNILTGKYTLGFSATGRFNRSDFGMSDYIPLVGDEILLEVYAEFQRN